MSHTHDKSSALGQGVMIFVYLTVLTILEFFVAVTFNAMSILLVVAVIKAALVMYYYMHVYKLNNDDGTDENSYTYKTGTNRIGLWLFLLSDAFVFAGLLVMRTNLLGFTRPHQLDQNLGLIVTAVLLISSFFMNRGETAMAYGDVKSFMNNTLITGILGLGFFLGVVFVEWRLAATRG
jgi:heme/copper-type cytochrome/quinol oxidase subunit 3